MNKYYFRTVTIFSLSLAFTMSCESLADLPDVEQYEERIVLNANLEVGSNSVFVLLHLSASIEELFDQQNNVLSGAKVILKYNSTQQILSESFPGLYFFEDDSFKIESGVTYTVEASDGVHPPVTATTIAPDPIEIYDLVPPVEWGDSLTYVPAGENSQFLEPYLFSFRVRPVGQGQFPRMVRLVNSGLNPSEQSMVMEDDSLKALLFKWQGIGYEDEEDIQKRIFIKSKVVFNSVDLDTDYKIAWIYHTFYRRQRLEVFAMGQSYYNYHIGLLEGFPQDPNYLPDSNVIGGFGLLASSHKVTLEYFLSRP